MGVCSNLSCLIRFPIGSLTRPARWHSSFRDIQSMRVVVVRNARPGSPAAALLSSSRPPRSARITRARRLDRPTQSAEEMFRAAVPLLAGEANGRAFRLIGIGAHDLVGAREVAIGGPLAGSGYGPARPSRPDGPAVANLTGRLPRWAVVGRTWVLRRAIAR